MAVEEEEYMSDGGTIVEEREEKMVDPTSSQANQIPTLRNAHFLKPSLNPGNYSPCFLPSVPKIQPFSHTVKPRFFLVCRSNPIKGWKEWVVKMQETHESAWRKAGIFDAIKCSTYHICRDHDLIYRLVEMWCPVTNTFVLPWGEVTVTLEDVVILGGFSPLGGSVNKTGDLGKNVGSVTNKLQEYHRQLQEIDTNVSHLRWQENFMGWGDEMEYAGFLAVWLSRHVFPMKSTSVVSKKVFPLAARISCGPRIALAPAVLAAIYRDLTLLRKIIVGGLSGQFYDKSSVRLTAPLHLVLAWAWERFPSLGPVPRMVSPGETRLARWDGSKRRLRDGGVIDWELCVASTRETFRWRPYAVSLENWSLPGFYVESGTWVEVESDEDWKLFACCLMVCELVGFDSCTQAYNPHRVALQFGFDQDIPVFIDVSDDSCKLSWLGYRKKFRGLRLYLPPRLHEGDVTQRYSSWWRTALHGKVVVGCKKVKRITNLCVGSKESPLIMPEVESENCLHNVGGQDKEVTVVQSCNEPSLTVMSPLVRSEGDTGKSQPDEPTTEAGILIGVAPEMGTLSALAVEGEQGKASDDGSDYYNPFATLCLEFETRISRLEKEYLALKAAAGRTRGLKR